MTRAPAKPFRAVPLALGGRRPGQAAGDPVADYPAIGAETQEIAVTASEPDAEASDPHAENADAEVEAAASAERPRRRRRREETVEPGGAGETPNDI